MEDDELLLRAMKRDMGIFARDLAFLFAANAAEALAILASERPQVVVTDVNMPGMSGIELLRRIKSNPETTAVEVIILSGRHTSDLEMEALAGGASAIREKPLAAKDLVQLIRGLPVFSQLSFHDERLP